MYVSENNVCRKWQIIDSNSTISASIRRLSSMGDNCQGEGRVTPGDYNVVGAVYNIYLYIYIKDISNILKYS